MKTKLLPLLLMLLCLTAFAQNDLKARIEYEDAETAFAAEDYNKAITHLTEAEKLLGKWTPKVGYLLIVSLYKTLDNIDFNNQQLETLEKHIKQYMQFANTNEAIDMGKFREINTIEQKIDSKFGLEYLEKKDFKNAMIYLKKAADKGNDTAMNNIGDMYDNGDGVPQNYIEAMNWYKKAADKGNTYAMNNIGILNYFGNGISQNYIEAMNWYKKAADKGNIPAMRNIGLLYKNGEGVPQNYTEAINWYKKAANKDDAKAMFNIGSIYFDNNNISKNYKEALNWLLKAYQAGHLDAKRIIIKIYEMGDYSMKKDEKLAQEWRNK